MKRPAGRDDGTQEHFVGMTLHEHETELRGRWRIRGGQVESDATCARIERLVREDLRKLGTDASGWDVLYEDPADGRLWELTYPESHLHGGGPPRLTLLGPDEARRKYGGLAPARSGA